MYLFLKYISDFQKKQQAAKDTAT